MNYNFQYERLLAFTPDPTSISSHPSNRGFMHQIPVLSVRYFRYHRDEIFIIDVSQSVEHDHPHALEFLRKDCTNITGQH